MTHNVHLDNQCRIGLAETAQKRLAWLELAGLPGTTVAATGVLGAVRLARSRLCTKHRPAGA
jgi:hypothetical protein